MKRFNMFLSLLIICAYLLSLPADSIAQRNQVRPSLKAGVSQRIGLDTDITVDYSRPGVKGRKIWGDLVPYGLYPGSRRSQGKPYPWRAGANENTTVEFSKDVMVEGKALAAGKYGIHMIASKDEWTVMFSKSNSDWGSFAYNQDNDALRITVTPKKAPHKEWLVFGFEDLAGTSATMFMHWEEIKVQIKIQTTDEK